MVVDNAGVDVGILHTHTADSNNFEEDTPHDDGDDVEQQQQPALHEDTMQYLGSSLQTHHLEEVHRALVVVEFVDILHSNDWWGVVAFADNIAADVVVVTHHDSDDLSLEHDEYYHYPRP